MPCPQPGELAAQSCEEQGEGGGGGELELPLLQTAALLQKGFQCGGLTTAVRWEEEGEEGREGGEEEGREGREGRRGKCVSRMAHFVECVVSVRGI